MDTLYRGSSTEQFCSGSTYSEPCALIIDEQGQVLDDSNLELHNMLRLTPVLCSLSLEHVWCLPLLFGLLAGGALHACVCLLVVIECSSSCELCAQNHKTCRDTVSSCCHIVLSADL
jgi:hypothetical protein